MVLQMVLGFGLKSRFDEEFLRKLMVENASRRDMAKLAAAIGFGEKMGGKSYSGTTTSAWCGLVKLIGYLRNVSRLMLLKASVDNALISPGNLRKRASLLEKTKAERKRGTSAATATKSQNKRGHGTGGGRDSGPTPYRQAKAAKFSNNYSSFSRRNAPPPAQHSPARRYSGPFHYPSQSVYEGSAAALYASTYGISHAQSPSAISQQPYHHSQSPSAVPQQLYSQPAESMSAAGFCASGSYGSQTSYGAYDYGSAAPVTYQPSSYTQ
ncbi:hypothetical protein POTOM_056101 [Populus tomentosa]|uniref:FRIGIDA-like protein n=1 Tax=Populus tomentosa TaxID=118781 RepID=A0A8X8C4K4_POPTO|nr:hypothetical protein POTOM_056101 [Populus tomentosa]